MSYELIEKEKIEQTKPYPNYRIILLNDSKNKAEYVAKCLQKHIPGMSQDKAWQLTMKVHSKGAAVVWVGPKEVAELYYELLKSEGLRTRLEPM